MMAGVDMHSMCAVEVLKGQKQKKGDAERAHVPAFKACKAQVNKTNYSSMVARFLLRSARTASNTKEEGIT